MDVDGHATDVCLGPRVTGGWGTVVLNGAFLSWGLGEGLLQAMPGGSPAQRLSSHSTPAHGPVIALPPLPVVWAQEGEQGLTLMHMCPGRRTLWLNIGGKEAAALSMFQVSTPLPVVSDHATRQGRCWGAHGCVPLLLAGTS